MVRSILGHGVLAAACLLLGRPRAAEALKIMTIGDSITEGWTVPCGYRAQLWDLLEQAGYQDLQFNGVLDTCGSQVTKCDDRCGQLQENNDFKHHNGFAGFKIHEVEESLDDILPWRTGAFPDIILVLLGTNDCLKAPANDVWTSQRRMKTLLSNIKGRRPGAKLIVGTIPPISRETQAEYGGKLGLCLCHLLGVHKSWPPG
eukprot:scaffold1026_cov409-Prasinococcus_capsulatus_cf.AAC.14